VTSFYGGTAAIAGAFTLESGTVYPKGSDLVVSFADPLELTVDQPVLVDSVTGGFTFTVRYTPLEPAEYSETVMTVSAPGFTAAEAFVYIPEPD